MHPHYRVVTLSSQLQCRDLTLNYREATQLKVPKASICPIQEREACDMNPHYRVVTLTKLPTGHNAKRARGQRPYPELQEGHAAQGSKELNIPHKLQDSDLHHNYRVVILTGQ